MSKILNRFFKSQEGKVGSNANAYYNLEGKAASNMKLEGLGKWSGEGTGGEVVRGTLVQKQGGIWSKKQKTQVAVKKYFRTSDFLIEALTWGGERISAQLLENADVRDQLKSWGEKWGFDIENHSAEDVLKMWVDSVDAANGSTTGGFFKNGGLNAYLERQISEGKKTFINKPLFIGKDKSLVMPYVPNTLQDLVGNLSEKDTCCEKKMEKLAKGVMTRVMIGVQHLHSAGIKHNDLKPRNICIDLSTLKTHSQWSPQSWVAYCLPNLEDSAAWNKFLDSIQIIDLGLSNPVHAPSRVGTPDYTHYDLLQEVKSEGTFHYEGLPGLNLAQDFFALFSILYTLTSGATSDGNEVHYSKACRRLFGALWQTKSGEYGLAWCVPSFGEAKQLLKGCGLWDQELATGNMPWSLQVTISDKWGSFQVTISDDK